MISASDRSEAVQLIDEATAPNQVWMWDITYLRGPIKGQFYYLYLISDLYSRDIVGWKSGKKNPQNTPANLFVVHALHRNV